MGSKLVGELEKFSVEQRGHIYSNVFAIELTDGCSIGCDFCGFNAPIGVKNYIPFDDLKRIADEMHRFTDRTTSKKYEPYFMYRRNRLVLYDATEPLDYEVDGKDYFDCRELFASKGFEVATSTAIPKGKEELAIANLNHIQQISISHMNRNRLVPYFERLGVVLYLDLFNYYSSKFGKKVFEASPIHDGQINVDGTIEETVAQLREQDPTLPSKTRFYDLRTDKNRWHDEVQDLNTLVLWCGREEFPPRDGRIVDKDESGVLNFGRAYNFPPYPVEHWQSSRRDSFCNISGVKLTPEGVFNVMSVRGSEKCKTGRIIEKVSPDDFKILKLQRIDNPFFASRIYPEYYASLKKA